MMIGVSEWGVGKARQGGRAGGDIHAHRNTETRIHTHMHRHTQREECVPRSITKNRVGLSSFVRIHSLRKSPYTHTYTEATAVQYSVVHRRRERVSDCPTSKARRAHDSPGGGKRRRGGDGSGNQPAGC